MPARLPDGLIGADDHEGLRMAGCAWWWRADGRVDEGQLTGGAFLAGRLVTRAMAARMISVSESRVRRSQPRAC